MRLPGPLTAQAFGALTTQRTVGGAGGSSLLRTLETQDLALQRLYRGEWPPAESEFVRTCAATRPAASDVNVDVAVCGGTLGLLLACALQLKGHNVAVLEAGPVSGRDQDWNTSLEELRRLVSAGVLSEDELEYLEFTESLK